MVFRTGKVT